MCDHFIINLYILRLYKIIYISLYVFLYFFDRTISLDVIAMQMLCKILISYLGLREYFDMQILGSNDHLQFNLSHILATLIQLETMTKLSCDVEINSI